MNYNDVDKSVVWGELKRLADGKNRTGLAADVAGCSVPMAAGLVYNWAAKAAGPDVVSALAALAGEQELAAKYQALLDGEVINTGENRKVLHHLLRGQCGKAVIHDGKDLGAFYQAELDRFCDFAARVQSGGIKSSAGKNFRTVVQIGIGGSDLGPRAVYLALDNWAQKNGVKKLDARFISNVDPDDASAVVNSVKLDETMFVLVSKSGTTQETLANELFVKDKLQKAGLDPKKHLVAVTSETSPLAHNPSYLDSFYIDDFIGGRYSSSSAVGGVILSLAFGGGVFKEFLSGAHEADLCAREPDPLKNAALLDALLGVWECTFLGYPATAVLPYSQALSRFPAHLQQLDMESNGKSVNRRGEKIAYKTGPVLFGESGTNGQHSFYQLLHQGTGVIPLQFIGFRESQRADDIEVDASTSQTKLNANLAAQIVAFAKGKDDDNPNKFFAGGRPSSLIYGRALTPKTLGALLAHFENKVMFQGFAWNLNSFDQEGVQLGKLLAKKVLSGNSDDNALDAYSKLLGVT
ncbi:MAG: glucose-6-phosphate isomerase [Treponema sp.]|jgi:glucose-6-phosphate isomerase|nr:glucose-6-phosphate isomerase [Treponema sp.]